MKKKAQRLVCKAALTVILLLCSFSYAQNNIGSRELIVLNKIIDDFQQDNPKIAYLRENPTNWSEGELRKYYEYRYEGKISGKIVLGMKDDEIIYDTDENNKKMAEIIFSKHATLDFYFTQSDLKSTIEQKQQPKWNASDFEQVQILKEEDEDAFSYEKISLYGLSRPFFSSDGKFMAVRLITFSRFLYIYKLENDNWVKIETIMPF